MPRLLGLTQHTLFAELLDRSLDAVFDEQFPENGSFVMRERTNREGASRTYWYYQGYRPGIRGRSAQALFPLRGSQRRSGDHRSRASLQADQGVP